MTDLSMNEKMILVQYAIEKYEKEEELFQKLSSTLPEKDIQRSLDTLIGTQRVRRIGPEIIQNNTSHTELPELPENLKPIIDNIWIKILADLEDEQLLDVFSSIQFFQAFLVYFVEMYLQCCMHLSRG